jgi:2-C-methyl-D-erythritol 4-phosphate cytidylyltransferase
MILVCVCFAFAGVLKIGSYYVRIEPEDEAVKELAGLAAMQSAPEVLIVYSQSGEFDPQSALFYSNKRVLQATGGNSGSSSTLYHNNKPLAEVTSQQPAGIILAKDAVQPLLTDYAIEIVGQSHNLVYAKIRKK